MRKVTIITDNATYNSLRSMVIGGYHEIHEIHYLSSIEHLLATIDSIIENNLTYSGLESELVSVTVETDDKKAFSAVSSHYEHPDNQYCNLLGNKITIFTQLVQ